MDAHDAHWHDGGTRELDHTRGVPATAAISGHPLHPALIPFPIAFLVGALGTDLACGPPASRSGHAPACG